MTAIGMAGLHNTRHPSLYIILTYTRYGRCMASDGKMYIVIPICISGKDVVILGTYTLSKESGQLGSYTCLTHQYLAHNPGPYVVLCHSRIDQWNYFQTSKDDIEC